jgi:16S rRNA (uracil1498-N3)-methyltransferase
MALPFFYLSQPAPNDLVQLDEDTSRHIVSVLRMENGEELHLTDGKGWLFTAIVTDAHKKKCTVTIRERKFVERNVGSVGIGISLLKNVSRLEWFLEKATELGVAEILPLICHRTEKQHFRFDRMQQILVSAMLQSQQVWLPLLREPQPISQVMTHAVYQQKWIAHCTDTDKKSLRSEGPRDHAQLLLIGPEGDFTPEEIELALSHGFEPVALGDTRLRSETAGMTGAVLLCVR